VVGMDDDDGLARIADYGDDLLTDDEMAVLAPAPGQQPGGLDHYENLAEMLDENYLAELARDVVEWADSDEQSRAEWYERERAGMILMGLVKDTKYVAPFEGASDVVHPLLAEACSTFQARAIAELWPSGGPVKSIVLGDDPDGSLAEQAERVRDFINYQYTQVNDGFTHTDKMLARLPMSGSCFKKQWFCWQTRIVRSTYVPAEDFLVPYTADSLMTTPRYTHRMRNVSGRTIKRLQARGYYRDDVRLMESTNLDNDQTIVHEAVDEAEGRHPVDYYETDEGYLLLECNCYLDLPGFESPDGVPSPYVVTVEKESQVVLSVRRAWLPDDDDDRERFCQYAHYYFLPGFGFYGYGFAHLLGGLARAATGSLRGFLDAAGFANARGGFMSRDAKMPSNAPLAMGEWRQVEMTAEELAKCFFPMDYREPSDSMFHVLGYLDQIARRYSSSTETLVGDAKNTGPVGTTLALIEQGLKVFTAIHKRLHEAQAIEFRNMVTLYSIHLPDGPYPYLVEGAEKIVARTDFDARVDVAPVSDPNTPSTVQKITQAQAIVELSERAPDLYDRREVHKRMLIAMQVQDPDTLMPEPGELEPKDPITEGAQLFRGEPAKAFIEQDHKAHLTAHRIWWEQMVPEDMRKQLEPAYVAHMAEHLAFDYQLQVLQQLGLGPEALEDPQLAQQLAGAAAQVAQLMSMDSIGLGEGDAQSGEDPERESARKDAEAQAKIQRDNQMAEADLTRRDAEAQAKIERDNLRAAADIERMREQEERAAERDAAKLEAEKARVEAQKARAKQAAKPPANNKPKRT